MNNIDNSAGVDAQEAQVTLLGDEFKPGAEANAEIERLLGLESQVISGQAYRRAPGTGDDVFWEESPDYCGDDVLTLELLEQMGNINVMVMESLNAPKRKPKSNAKPFVQEHVALFDFADVLYCTVPFEKEEHAVACAFWFLLSR